MKIKTLIFSIACITAIACSVVVEENEQMLESNTIEFDNVFPESVIDANAFLVGSDGRTWNTLAFTIEGVNGVQNCRMDDEITLKTDNTYIYDGGTMLCGAEDNLKIKTGTWTFETDSRTLIFDEDTDRQSLFYIESLTSEEIVVSSHYYNWKVVGKFANL